jgi:hypothetical protein
LGSKYSSQSSSGYNASPPSDDGSVTPTNKVQWSTIKTKLTDTLKTFAEAINTALTSVLDLSTTAVTADTTAGTTHHWQTIEVKTASANVTLSDAATMAAGYKVNVKNSSSGIITVKRTTSTDSISGMQRDIQLASGHSRTFKVNGATTGYLIESSHAPISICQGRLTLTAGTAVTISDVTAATLVQWSPYGGNLIGLYTGSEWVTVPFSETTCVVPSTSSTPFDIWCSLTTAGGVVIDTTSWTNDTTRATALTLQNGVYVKTGDPGRRYLGTGRTTTTPGQTQDATSGRFLWNYYNRVKRKATGSFSTGRTTTSTSFTELNTEIQNKWIVGVLENDVDVSVAGGCDNSAPGQVSTAVAIDSTTSAARAQIHGSTSASARLTIGMVHSYTPTAVGYHYSTVLGMVSAGTGTWYGGASSTSNEAVTLQTAVWG